MDAAVITVGNELLEGFTQDTNTHYLAVNLRDLGIRLMEAAIVRDDVDMISRTIRRMLSSYQVVFVCGGLGTTPDDVTYQGVAAALSRPMVRNPEAERYILRRISETQLPEAYQKMTVLPEGSQVLGNDVGLAPGLFIQHGDAMVFVLPGPPRELRHIYEAHIHNRILVSEEAPYYTELRTPLYETQIHELLVEFSERYPELELGSYPQSESLVVLRIGGPKERVEEARAYLEKRLNELTS